MSAHKPCYPRADVSRLIRVIHLFSPEDPSQLNPDSSCQTDYELLLQRDRHNLEPAIYELNNTNTSLVRRRFALRVAGATHRFRLGTEAHETKSRVTSSPETVKKTDISSLRLGALC
jgi:hypothetical protein